MGRTENAQKNVCGDGVAVGIGVGVGVGVGFKAEMIVTVAA